MMSVATFFGEKKLNFQTPMTPSKKQLSNSWPPTEKKPKLDLDLEVLKTIKTQN